jgi:glycosyltransferase involved in cell wall biosynthesis
MSNLRVYIISPTFLPMVGGTERQTLAHSLSLRERGFETTIITPRHERHWLAREVIEGVPVIRVAGILLGGRGKLPGLLRKLLYLLGLLVMSWTLWRHRQRYDALHLYHLGVEVLPVALVCRLTGKPLIVSVRCADSDKSPKPDSKAPLLAESLGASAPWQQVDKRSRREGDLAGLESLGKPAVRLAYSLLRNIGAVIVLLSTRMKSYLAAHDFNLPDVQLIPNGVDITRFHPICADSSAAASQCQQNERSHIVVCVSKLRYEKGIDVLLRAWCLVQQESPQSRLIIVGDGPLQEQLERMAGTLGIADCVEFTGLQSDVLGQLYRGCLVVLPSRWEGMPNTLLEAMACGLPCVATRVSGSEDIIQHRVNGLLVEPGDYQSIAQALLTLLHDPVLSRKYGEAARTKIEKDFALELITDRYVELYQKIVARRSEVAGVCSHLRAIICRLNSSKG